MLSSAGESRWRRAQRRRQRLTLRGRVTLAVCVLAAFVGLLSVAAFSLDHPAPDPGPVEAVSLAPVEAEVTALAPLQAPPREIFERLPVTHALLDLPVASGADGDRFYEVLTAAPPGGDPQPFRVQYSFHPGLSAEVYDVLERGRVSLGHVVIVDPRTGRLLAYASTDIEQFPPTRTYPAASLVKVITAAAAMGRAPSFAHLPCRYQGSPYLLTPSRIDPPKRGNEVSLTKALATSNNQCFAQLAVHALGGSAMMDAISAFGWLSSPAPAHAAGTADPGEDRFGVGQLGCGLAGSRITPLHAAQLAATLVNGELVSPSWIESVLDEEGRELPLPARAAPRRVISAELADELRMMLVETTARGTARRAFRSRGGRPRLGPVAVAGKTGSLSGTDPKGRYEWFAGVAPADEPRIAVAVLLVQSDLWWRTASQVAADVLQGVFCEGRKCSAELASRWLDAGEWRAAAVRADETALN